MQKFPQQRLEIYIRYAPIPVFGVKRYWYRYEFAKSRGQIRFHMFAIYGDKHPRRLLRELRGGCAQEEADALATWAWGSLALSAPHPASTPVGEPDIARARAPDGAWVPPKDSNAAGLLLREATSFREHCIARVNSYCFHTCSYYCMRAPRRGANVSETGTIRREFRMWLVWRRVRETGTLLDGPSARNLG